MAALGGGGRASVEPQGGDAHRRGCAAAPGDLQADRRIRWLRSYSGPRGVLVLILGWLSREAELAWHLETNPYRQLRVCTQDKPILPIKDMYPTFPYNLPLFYSGLGVSRIFQMRLGNEVTHPADVCQNREPRTPQQLRVSPFFSLTVSTGGVAAWKMVHASCLR